MKCVAYIKPSLFSKHMRKELCHIIFYSIFSFCHDILVDYRQVEQRGKAINWSGILIVLEANQKQGHSLRWWKTVWWPFFHFMCTLWFPWNFKYLWNWFSNVPDNYVKIYHVLVVPALVASQLMIPIMDVNSTTLIGWYVDMVTTREQNFYFVLIYYYILTANRALYFLVQNIVGQYCYSEIKHFFRLLTDFLYT